MVLPERDVPGIKARICAKPTTKASLGRMSSTRITLGVRVLWRFSIHKISRPPTTKAVATLMGLNKKALICLLNNKPTTAAGIKAMAKLSTKRLVSGSRPMWVTTWAKRRRYSNTTANTAPS